MVVTLVNFLTLGNLFQYLLQKGLRRHIGHPNNWKKKKTIVSQLPRVDKMLSQHLVHQWQRQKLQGSALKAMAGLCSKGHGGDGHNVFVQQSSRRTREEAVQNEATAEPATGSRLGGRGCPVGLWGVNSVQCLLCLVPDWAAQQADCYSQREKEAKQRGLCETLNTAATKNAILVTAGLFCGSSVLCLCQFQLLLSACLLRRLNRGSGVFRLLHCVLQHGPSQRLFQRVLDAQSLGSVTSLSSYCSKERRNRLRPRDQNREYP